MSAQPASDETRPLTVKQSGTVPVTSHVPAWVWRCEVCGWLGTGWTSESGAEKEGADHVWNEHGIAACAPEQYGGPHIWEPLAPWNDVSKCARCGWEVGK